MAQKKDTQPTTPKEPSRTVKVLRKLLALLKPKQNNSDKPITRPAKQSGKVSKPKTQSLLADMKDPHAEREAVNYAKPIASRELILQVIHQEGAMTFERVQDVLKLDSEEEIEALRRRLGAMVRDGQLIRNRRDGYIPVDEADLVRGRVIAHADGFGFLVPDEGGEDVFLHGKQMRTLLHGDRAVVQISGVDRRGRREGAVIEVLERANHRVVGRLTVENGIAFVMPDNKRLTQTINVPMDALGTAVHGQIVIVEIVQQPTFRNQTIGKITDVIGEHMAPGMEIDIAIHSHNLPFLWPDAVKEYVAGMKPEVLEADKQNRLDLRQTPLVTIDGEDARDFDDAVYCEPTANGWKLLVAIADVSHYVERGTALDEEAHTRGTSVYFPGRVIPMLPEILSNGLCSINPHVDRLCMVCEMTIDGQGKMQNSTFHEAVMNSHARLTYTEVSAMLEDKDQTLRQKYAAVVPHLENLYELYKALGQQRKLRHAIDFETIETKIMFGDGKKIDRIVPYERNEAHKLIEECMISANVAAAQFIEKHAIPGLFRVHEGPKVDKIDDVRDFVLSLGLQFGKAVKASVVKGKEKSPVKPTAEDYSRLIAQVKDRPDFHLIQTVLLRSLSQAVYTPDNKGHFGLSLESYAHFTSPIRRYPDLLVHRAIRHVLRGGKVERYFYRHSDMVKLGEHSSACERRADEATRDAETALKCEYMQDKVGEIFDGLITSVTSFGIFVELQDIYIEGLVHITSLPKDYYQFEPIQHRLIGERSGRVFRLGDEVEVKVMRVNFDERKIDFELADEDNSGEESVHKKSKKRSRKRKGERK